MKIDGKTKIYGILGDPIKQVATPELMNSIFKKNGENKVLIPFHVNQVSLELTIQGLKKIQNFKGAVITMPHKVEILKYLDETSDEVKMIGACNVIKRTPEGIIKGELLDGKGFIQGLKSNNHFVESKRVFLLGCGGAASAIAFALCENKIQKLSIFNRTKSKAMKLIDKLTKAYPNIDISYSDNVSNDLNILINGTSVGMKESDKPLLSLSNLNSNTLVADIIISPEMTCTLKQATQKGCQIHKGIAMLEGQIKLMNEFMN
ncbi:shikimate dehydrogenase [Kordia periserrulae]|uniref:shikimate dehydrogenase (NADP(+)) n=1 Tax=Kordia periserrulae TaxID=701523 RepID=A0A2T6BQL7_9FLAO|nr:shikimate dehydrogenase [Kordia periserrulae]PTX58390.1 shikimate dehydrogenase [Kordia periserrulae]